MSRQQSFTLTESVSVSPALSRLRTAERALARVLEPNAPNTERVYAQARRRWALWCEREGVSELFPIDAAQLVIYLEELSETLSPRTVRVTLAALSSFDRAARTTPTDPTPAAIRSSPIVRRWLKSWARSVRDVQPRKAPALGRGQLLTIVRGLYEARSVRGYNPQAVELQRMRDRALLLIGWLGCLRRSELAALKASDIRETERGLELTITASKTDQRGSTCAVNLYRQQGSELCAVDAWRVWRLVLEQRGALDAFPRIDQRGELGAALSPAAVGELVTRRAQAVGLAALGHSLRRGFATEAAGQRKPEADIAKHGRWQTTAIVREYVERESSWDFNPTEGIT